MATHYYATSQYHSNPNSHSHNHHGRSRRGPKMSSQGAQRQYRAQRSPKEVPEPPAYLEYVQRLEAAKSFEFDDDEIFCPFHLLTEDDLQSIHSSSSSDRGSLSSGSPEGSPLQHQVQPTPSFMMASAQQSMNNAASVYQSHMKIHQPMAQRTRNAIPIVDPASRSIASPPLSVSPARQMQQQYNTRRW